MLKRVLLAVLSMTVVLPIISHASDSSQDQRTTEKQAEKPWLEMAKDQIKRPIVLFASRSEPTVTVQLSSNPSTGYKWYMAKGDDVIKTVTQSFTRGEAVSRDGAVMSGVPGTSTWTFTLGDDAFDYPQQIRLLLVNKHPGKTVAQMIKQPVFIFTSEGK